MRKIDVHSDHSIGSHRLQASEKAKHKVNAKRAIKLSKTLDKVVRIGLCSILLFQSVLFITVRPVAAGVTMPATPPAAQDSGTTVPGTPVKASATAVINFAQLAAQEAGKPVPSGPPVPQVIHSPVTPPEVDAQVPGKQPESPAPPAAQLSPAVISPSPA